jgi:hypothetical protein
MSTLEHMIRLHGKAYPNMFVQHSSIWGEIDGLIYDEGSFDIAVSKAMPSRNSVKYC